MTQRELAQIKDAMQANEQWIADQAEKNKSEIDKIEKEKEKLAADKEEWLKHKE